MRRRACVVAALAALLLVLGDTEASAHATLVSSDPASGATLAATPSAVRLVFTEEPEVELSQIEVVDPDGGTHQTGDPQPVPGDPRALDVAVGPLERSLYTVRFQVVSAVDGHATSGAFVFGVGVSPSPSDLAATETDDQPVSGLEVVGRWIFVVGLIALLGSAVGRAAGFAAATNIRLPAAGWAMALLGLALLAEAQRRSAGASYADLQDTSLGHALAGRTVALAAAGGSLLVARSSSRRASRFGSGAAAVAAAAAVGVHVAAGHAGGGWASVATQWTHFVAAGVWIGGLAALLVATRGAESASKAAAVRSFSVVAGAMLGALVATGVVRAVDELGSWDDLATTGYGKAVVAKSLLFVGLAGLGAVNRWRSVPLASGDLGPLRRVGRVELATAGIAMLVAAVLGSVPPPATAAEPGLVATGTDFATSVRVRLTAATDQPGANRFSVRVTDHDSGERVAAESVVLEFTPLDDPGVPSTSLTLEADADGAYVGAGANLAFDGRWRIDVLIQQAADSVTVPLEIEASGPPQFVSVEQVPGRPVFYTIEAAGGLGFVQVYTEPERAGPARVFATIVDPLLQELPVEQLVVTLTRGSAGTDQQVVRRLGSGEFVADIDLEAGRTTVAVVAHTASGIRLRAAVDLDIE